MEHTNGHNTPVVVEDQIMIDGQYNWDSKKAQLVLKNTIAKHATNEEYALFREIARSSGLNPFQNELWCIITGEGQWRKFYAMTGINGFYRIANERDSFDGIEYEEGPMMTIDLGGSHGSIKAPEYIISRAYRKDRSRPQIMKAYWREFAPASLITKKGKLSIWAKMPTVLLTKCADSHSLRKLYPNHLNGVYTVEEMGPKYSIEQVHAEELSTGWDERKPEETYKHFALKHGSKAGTLLGDESLNQKHLENHLSKYRDEYSTAAQEAIAMRIDDLKRLYARSQDENTSVAAQEAAKRKLQNSDGGERKAVSDVESRRELGDLYPETVDMDDEELEAWTLSRAEEE